MVQDLRGKLFGPGAQHRLVPLGFGDVGIDGDPAALRQGRPFDRDPAAIGALTFHVMCLEGAGLFNAQAHGLVRVVLRAVFAAQDQKADGVFEEGAGPGQVVGQIEQRLILAVGHRQPQVGIEDRQRLANQVQPRLHQRGP